MAYSWTQVRGQPSRWFVELTAAEWALGADHLPEVQHLLRHGSIEQMVEAISLLMVTPEALHWPEDPWSPALAPGMTDLMVDPDTLDAWLEEQ